MAYTIKNIARGYRGFHSVAGLVMLAPGQTATDADVTDAEIKSARSTGYFDIDGEASATAPTDDLDTTVAELKKIADREGVDTSGMNKADTQAAIRAKREATGNSGGGGSALDGMDDATLLTTTAAVTGKTEAELADKSRDELLALARGDA